jgi:acyl carrier protein
VTADPILARVRATVERVVGPLRRPTSAGSDTPLIEGGFWLGSIDLLEVVVACEHEFGIVLDPERDLTAEGLRTLETLAEVVRRKTSG